jgi:hypothetical protein
MSALKGSADELAEAVHVADVPRADVLSSAPLMWKIKRGSLSRRAPRAKAARMDDVVTCFRCPPVVLEPNRICCKAAQ